jgi:hypothetical protein
MLAMFKTSEHKPLKLAHARHGAKKS